ncbi:MAG TPA: hypothetical protein VK833_00670, partial [Gillisia sp.]|nr:hypothetical protein [Gillisia sp.]
MPCTETPNTIVITRVLRLITLIFIPFTFGLISLFLGKDINWDLRNYHYYNAYAFLENRLDFDIAPAQLQTFINPLADLPFYWLTKHFHPWVAGFVFGYVHGFNLSLVFIIFWKIFNLINKWKTFLIGICLVTISGAAPGFISELGNTMHDNLTSLFVLFAVFLLINALDMINNGRNSKGWAYLGAGGLIMGMGVGIKPSVTIFAMSTALIFIVFQTSWTNRLKSLFIYATTGIIGGISSAGFWWLEMWRRFGNPFFPFYNHIFKSPYFTTTQINWSPYLPRHLWEYFIWPIIFTFDSVRTNQFYFFDIRFALIYILFLIWPIAVFLRKSRLIQPVPANNESIFGTESGNFLLLFYLLSYILWLKESAT